MDTGNKDLNHEQTPLNEETGGRNPSRGKSKQDTPRGKKKDKGSILGEEVENPAAQSEIGPNIYDIGMGGPGASTSGLRDTNDEKRQENEDE